MNSFSPETMKSNTQRTPYSSNAQDHMLIQDGYCSPERPSYKDSSRQTPKSILKEYTNTSGSKSKKGIVINETLNETRKLSLKSESSETSARNKKRPLSAADTSLASFEAQIRGSSKKYSHHQPANKSGFGNLWTSEGFSTGTRSEAQHISDFQKAYVKKLQRDREQELYCELVRRSNASLSQDRKVQNQEENTNVQYENNRQLLKTIEQKKRNLDSQRNTKEPEENPASLTRVEEKIEELEKCLDIYSNRLRDSIIRQRDQLIAGQFIKTGSVPETLPIRRWEEKEDYVEHGSISENRKDLDKSSKSKSYPTRNKISTHLSERWEGLNHELDQLKEESRHLASTVRNQATEKFASIKSENNYDKQQSEILDKELELLKTIEDIRTKLYNSVSQRSFEKRNKQSKTNPLLKTSSSTAGMKKTSTNNNTSLNKTSTEDQSKYQKMRKAYGAETLERENACILNEGLSSVYNGFHWNADNSLKINRNI